MSVVCGRMTNLTRNFFLIVVAGVIFFNADPFLTYTVQTTGRSSNQKTKNKKTTTNKQTNKQQKKKQNKKKPSV